MSDRFAFPATLSGPVDTSIAAAKSQSVYYLSKTRIMLLRMVAESATGMIADEIEVILNKRSQSVTPRLTELCGMGMLEMTPEKRPTRSGRRARVYKVTPEGIAVLTSLVVEG